MKFNSNTLICAAVCMAVGFSASASTFYTAGFNNNLFQMSDGVQVGNEVSLSGRWILTNFSFEYYSPNTTLNAALNVELRIYLNDGPLSVGHPTPGTLIYDSGLYYNTAAGNLTAGSFPPYTSHEINYSSSDLYSGPAVNLPTTPNGYLMPSDFTYTLTFNNLSTNSIYIPLANNQTANVNLGGITTYGDYWLNSGGSWTLLNINGTPANFLVTMAGIPEPQVLYLGAIGSAMLFGFRKLKRKI